LYIKKKVLRSCYRFPLHITIKMKNV